MRKYIIFLITLSCLICLNQVEASTITAQSCSQEDVQAAINQAQAGDTIEIPAGQCDWLSFITINKSLKIMGATSGCPDDCKEGTVIIKKGESELIRIIVSENKQVDISGLTLDGGGLGGGIVYIYNSSFSPFYNLRIHHNEIRRSGSIAINTKGENFGLIDNNRFTDNYQLIKPLGRDSSSWNNYPAINNLGTANYLYIENNIANDLAAALLSSGEGARWVLRYNDIDTIENHFPLLDAHGDTKNRGVVAHELYENRQTSNLTPTMQIHDYRGGTGIIFNNKFKVNNASHIKVREEYGIPGNPCKPDEWSLPYGDLVEDGYLWNNRDQNNKLVGVVEYDCADFIEIDKNYWTDAANSQTGGEKNYQNFFYNLGSNRPDFCTKNDIFWETDNRNLYRCVENNNWQLIYQPYIYPHPLTIAPFGTIICNEGPITSQCWCEGLKQAGSCYHGYYQSSETTPTCSLGDIDCNGFRDIQDLRLSLNLFLGSQTNSTYFNRADLNQDNQVNILDIQQLINLILES